MLMKLTTDDFLTSRAQKRLMREIEKSSVMISISQDLSSQIRDHEEKIRKHKVAVSPFYCKLILCTKIDMNIFFFLYLFVFYWVD